MKKSMILSALLAGLFLFGIHPAQAMCKMCAEMKAGQKCCCCDNVKFEEPNPIKDDGYND